MQASPKRPRGRPRIDEPPKPVLHIRLAPKLKAELEEDARRAKRSVRKEIEVRLQKSYLRDEMYGGSKMASLFRELAEVASAIESQKSRGSFFDDLEVFALIRDVWAAIIQRHIPPPSDELIAELRRERADRKARAPQNRVHEAAWEWLIRRTPTTLAQALAGAFEPASDKPGPRSEAKVTGPIGALADIVGPLLQSERHGEAFAVGDLGGLARIMEGLRPSEGTLGDAAVRVSRLAEIIAEAMEDSATRDAAIAIPTNPGDVTAPQ
jgi:hypothetical protein